MTDAQSAQTALDKLIEAVEAGSLIQPTRPHQAEDDCSDDWLSHPLLNLVPAGVLHIHQMGEMVRAYHGSLDAALALHEALLPGWEWGRAPGVGRAFWVRGKDGFIWSNDYMPPARAWLLAILRAYRSTQK